MATGGKKSSSGLSRSCVLIIVVAGVERFAYKGVVSNLVTYLTDVVGMSTSSAAKTVNSWIGVTSMLPLFGAFLADSYWDQYSTILASSFLYVTGLAALTSAALLSSWTTLAKIATPFFIFSLYLISIAQGGYNPCLQAFGAAQIENPEDELPSAGNNGEENSKNTTKKSLFFQWWYFGICTGSLMGITVMSYIQDNYGWGWGFAIPTLAMVISVGFMSFGTHLYVHNRSKGRNTKQVVAMIQSMKAAARKMIPGKIRLPEKEPDMIELQFQQTPLKDEPQSPDFSSEDPTSTNPEQFGNWGAVLRLFPIWAMLLMFAVVFQQPYTFFTKQGMTMERCIMHRFMIPPATLQSAITISIIILMPFYDRAIIPALRALTRQEKGITVLQRMGIGMFLSIIAMAVAALVESKRRQISRMPGIVPLSIFWLMPQYILLGVSDVFTVVGMQEFFYSQVPNKMRTTGIALYLSVFGFGSFLSAVLISIVELVTCSGGSKQSWFSDDLDQARIDNYYWLLASLCILSLLMFIAMSRHYSEEKE